VSLEASLRSLFGGAMHVGNGGLVCRRRSFFSFLSPPLKITI